MSRMPDMTGNPEVCAGIFLTQCVLAGIILRSNSAQDTERDLAIILAEIDRGIIELHDEERRLFISYRDQFLDILRSLEPSYPPPPSCP